MASGVQNAKLSTVASALGLPCDEGVNGKDVPVLYRAGAYDEVLKHGAWDVAVTERAWRRLTARDPALG